MLVQVDEENGGILQINTSKSGMQGRVRAVGSGRDRGKAGAIGGGGGGSGGGSKGVSCEIIEYPLEGRVNWWRRQVEWRGWQVLQVERGWRERWVEEGRGTKEGVGLELE